MQKAAIWCGLIAAFFMPFSAKAQSSAWVFEHRKSQKIDTIRPGEPLETFWKRKKTAVEARFSAIQNDSIFLLLKDSTVIGERLERLETMILVNERPRSVADQNNGLRLAIAILGLLAAVLILPSMAKKGDNEPSRAGCCLAVLLIAAALTTGLSLFFRASQTKLKKPLENYHIRRVELP